VWSGICIVSVVDVAGRDIACATTGAGTAAGVDDALAVDFGVVSPLVSAESHCVGFVNMIREMHLDQGLRKNDSDKAPFCRQRLPARSNILCSPVFPRSA